MNATIFLEQILQTVFLEVQMRVELICPLPVLHSLRTTQKVGFVSQSTVGLDFSSLVGLVWVSSVFVGERKRLWLPLFNPRHSTLR